MSLCRTTPCLAWLYDDYRSLHQFLYVFFQSLKTALRLLCDSEFPKKDDPELRYAL